jgi:hypothetical protein
LTVAFCSPPGVTQAWARTTWTVRSVFGFGFAEGEALLPGLAAEPLALADGVEDGPPDGVAELDVPGESEACGLPLGEWCGSFRKCGS